MGKGPGRIERAIRQLFDANPDRAFITDELVEYCYPDAEFIEKKHTVAVLRAAHKVVARDPDWEARAIGRVDRDRERRNVDLCFLNMDSIESYALGRLITTDVMYRSQRPSPCRFRAVEDFDELRAMLEDEGHRKLIAPGGTWHRHLEMHRAERDGDTARLAQLNAAQEAGLARIAAGIRGAAEAIKAADRAALPRA